MSADEPIGERDDDDLGLPGLDELQAVALSDRADTLSLLPGRDEPLAVAVADARDAHDADGPTNGGSSAS